MESVGFEPTVLVAQYDDLANRCLKPAQPTLLMAEDGGVEPHPISEDLVFKTSRRPSQLHHLPCLVPLVRFELTVLLLLRETALPICPQGSGAEPGIRTQTVRCLRP